MPYNQTLLPKRISLHLLGLSPAICVQIQADYCKFVMGIDPFNIVTIMTIVIEIPLQKCELRVTVSFWKPGLGDPGIAGHFTEDATLTLRLQRGPAYAGVPRQDFRRIPLVYLAT